MVEGVIVNFHSDLQRPFLKKSSKTEIGYHPTGYEKKSQHINDCQRKPENEICNATTHAENLFSLTISQEQNRFPKYLSSVSNVDQGDLLLRTF